MTSILAMPRLPTPIATRAPGSSRAARPHSSRPARAAARTSASPRFGKSCRTASNRDGSIEVNDRIYYHWPAGPNRWKMCSGRLTTTGSMRVTNKTASRWIGLAASLTLLALMMTPQVAVGQAATQAPATPAGGPPQGPGRGGRGGGVAFGPPTTQTRYDDYTGFTKIFDGQTFTN